MMSLLNKLSRTFFYRVLILLALFISLIVFLLTTTPGLFILYEVAALVIPGHLQIEGISGQAINQITFKHLHYVSKTLDVEANDFSLSWHPQDLRKKKLSIHQIAVAKLKIIETAESTDQPKTSDSFSLPSLPLSIDLQHVSCQELQISQKGTSHQIDRIHLQAWMTAQTLQVDHLDLVYKGHQLIMRAITQTQWPYQAAVNLQLHPLASVAQGYTGNIELKGDTSAYQWHGSLSKPSPLQLQGALINLQAVSMSAQWTALDLPLGGERQLTGNQGQLLINGTLPNLHIQLDADISKPWAAKWRVNADTNSFGFNSKTFVKSGEGDFNLDLSYQTSASPKIHGRLIAKGREQASVALKDINGQADFSGDSPETLNCHSQFSAQYYANKLQGVLNYQEGNLNALVNLGDNRLQASHTTSSPWQIKAVLTNLPLLHPSLKGLQTMVTADASLMNDQEGSIDLRINEGSYQLPDSPVLLFQGGDLQATLGKAALTGSGNFVIDPQKRLRLAFKMPDFTWQQAGNGTQFMDSDVQLTVNSLSFLQQISPLISEVSGQLQANLQTKGTLGNPQLAGKLALEHASLSINKFGMHLNPVSINLISENKQWQVQGELAANGQSLKLGGQGLFFPEVSGFLNLKGEIIPLINTPEYLLVLSPDLHFEFAPALLKLTGAITIPKALIAPQSFGNSVNLSDDVVFAGDELPTNPLHLDTDLQIIMGKDVALSVKGLQGLLSGGIHIRQLAQGPLNATGELTIHEGKYKAYGQDLAIEQGQLIFTGGQLTNPGLELRAVRQFSNTNTNLNTSNQLFDFNPDHMQTLDFGDKTTVGIEASGHLLSPKIRLFSNPPTLSQADILSMLLLGKPASQANQAGGQLLLTAISSMNLGNGSKGMQLMEQLKQKLGFDLNLTNNTQYNQKTNQTTENTGVVVGKSISKRIYLSYNMGFSQTDSNVLTLKYLLNKFFSVQVNASMNASGVDLLYTHQKD